MRIQKYTNKPQCISVKKFFTLFLIKKLELIAVNPNDCHDKMAFLTNSFYHGIFNFSMLKEARRY